MTEQAKSSRITENTNRRVANVTAMETRAKFGDRIRSISRANYEQETQRVSRRVLINAELTSGDLDEPMPIFLAQATELGGKTERWEQDRIRVEGLKSWSVATRMILIALVATVIVVPVVFSKNPDLPLANATASEITPVTDSSGLIDSTAIVAKPPEKFQLASAGRDVPSVGGSNVGPTRDDIVAAYKSAVSIQTDGPRRIATVQSPARMIDKEELAYLLNRGQYLVAVGDIASARLLLERAAEAHESSAAFVLAGTYDPAVLGRRASGIGADLAMARRWYEKAVQLGSSEAQQRLDKLQK